MKVKMLLAAGIVITGMSSMAGGGAFTAQAADAPSVELGKKLFSDPALGTNGKTCATCHPSEKKVGELAARGTWFGGRAKTIEQAINICITGPLAGKALPEDSVEARSIGKYMKSLAK